MEINQILSLILFIYLNSFNVKTELKLLDVVLNGTFYIICGPITGSDINFEIAERQQYETNNGYKFKLTLLSDETRWGLKVEAHCEISDKFTLTKIVFSFISKTKNETIKFSPEILVEQNLNILIQCKMPINEPLIIDLENEDDCYSVIKLYSIVLNPDIHGNLTKLRCEGLHHYAIDNMIKPIKHAWFSGMAYFWAACAREKLHE
ncbi:hypothetical protein MXB_2701 [Myxobolus squamalis]|nr:hypothetical protein MXB_2701 [Myxobolus squamalis]